jgi:hypothetical protein
MISMCSSVIPLVVKAGVPSLIPPGLTADLSPTTEFLLVVICMTSKIFSIFDPVTPEMKEKREICFQSCSAKDGEGIWEGIVLLQEKMENYEKN